MFFRKRHFSLFLLLFCLPWNRNANALVKVVIQSSSKASKTVYFAGMFFCTKLPSTQNLATLTAVEKDDFHPLQKNRWVKYPGSRTGGLRFELQLTIHYSSKPRTPAAQKPTFHLCCTRPRWLAVPAFGLLQPDFSPSASTGPETTLCLHYQQGRQAALGHSWQPPSFCKLSDHLDSCLPHH